MDELFHKVHDSLPVFKIDDGKDVILYTPGYHKRLSSLQTDLLQFYLENQDLILDKKLRTGFSEVVKKAQETKEIWEVRKSVPFSPECLTIHVGQEFNPDSGCCYSEKVPAGNSMISGFPDLNSVETVFNHIVRNVKRTRHKITVVYHASEEPAFSWQDLVKTFSALSILAAENQVQLFSYITTNGFLSSEQADWIAENMDLIGITCDGVPGIQKLKSTANSNGFISAKELTSRIIDKKGKFQIRVTITRETINQQKKIVKYLFEKLGANHIIIEPCYLAGENGFREEDASVFFRSFKEALSYSDKNGVTLEYDGVRLNELHGTYCDVLRNTLRLTPDRLIRNCFCYMNNNIGHITGSLSGEKPELYLIPEIKKLKTATSEIPEACYECINIYHCSRGCPDYCILHVDNRPQELNSFRCRLHKLLAVDRIVMQSRKSPDVISFR
jgi:sulfatase maturation enzyme AslB (radical SAM superfamily)